MPEISSNGSWLRFDGMRLAEQQGTCYVRLGQPNLAEPALQEALTRLPSISRLRAMVLIDLAKTSLLRHEVEQTCAIANEVIDIVIQRPSGVISKGIQSLSTQLKPYSSLTAVKEFNQRLEVLL